LLKPRSIARFFFVVFILGVVGTVGVALLVFYYALQVPDPSILAIRRVNESTKIYDRTGENILYDVHGEEKRTIIPWEQIPQSIKDATLAAEDSDFYHHSGIDIRGIIRAVYQDLRNLDTSQGGSTITQQLVKITIVGEDKTFARKIKEAILAIKIERKYSKDQIFWMYLNQIPYGSNAYGIEAASETFFNKHAKDLTVSEASVLASLPKAPTYYSPYGNHVDDLFMRSGYVLLRMKNLGMIMELQYMEALQETPQFSTEGGRFESAHFVMMVRDYLVSKYGEDLVQNGGLKAITTLDKEKQVLAEEVVTKYGAINEKRYKADNAALVAVDPKTGQILAMVGSRDYWDIENHGNYNVALSKIRQPGSSFKPFAYATAFLHGFPDSTVVFDVLTEFNPSCSPTADSEYGSGPCYHPRNYLGNFSGPVTLRQGLARSLNVPSVKTLYLAGIDDTVATARSMGITSLDPNGYYGLSLVLGGAGVSLLDMTSAYGVFANDGTRVPSTFILKITTGDGAVLEEYKQEEERVLPSNIARVISDILSDNSARAPVFGVNNNLVVAGRQVAAKTGTTQNNRDGWLIGYTPSLSVGVWTGNNDDTPMTAAGAGVSAAGPMWNEFISTALKDTPLEYFPRPSPISSDKPMLNGNYKGPDGSVHSILYYATPSDPLGPIPVNPYDDPMFNNWEFGVRGWISLFSSPMLSSGSQHLF